ncbi:MAG: DNA polymerase elongation subunit (family B) [Thermoplasmata archaeon]|nr:MAG: DNA polymerase elongation subunit (family B) [Thermoplasmata archaeon]
MSDMLLGVSSDFLYLHRKSPQLVSDLHDPYFLVFPPSGGDAERERNRLKKEWENNVSSDNELSKIKDIGEVERYRSFWDSSRERDVFKVFTKKSYFVPEVSDYLFFKHGFYTAEHDIPYHQRVLVDLAAQNRAWIFDTGGEKKVLRVLVYDIETTQFEEEKTNVPIDIIGYSCFDIVFESEKDLEEEEFYFNILDCPSDWMGIDVKQMMAHNVDEEIDNLCVFCKTVMENDIVSGHNILGFDNLLLSNRVKWVLRQYDDELGDTERSILQIFIDRYARGDRSFHFGVGSDVVNFYPSSFDTYLASRKFYPFLDEYSLKTLAKFLDVNIKDRIVLTPSQIKLDSRTLRYNEQDVKEQLGITFNIIEQALPLAFTTCMPFDMLLPSGAVGMWDHMALIRGALHKKIMPPICKAMSIAQILMHDFSGCKNRLDIVKKARENRNKISKELIRVVKYGEEMPEWMEYPYVIYNDKAEDTDEILNYHIPGGMTIKPDKDAHSHFIPWWYVVVADVGAMYPTILKAMNIGADVVRLASKTEKPDAWIWLKKLPPRFLKERNVNWRYVDETDAFADQGVMLGIKIADQPGVVNLAMTGIINMIGKIKKELKQTKSREKTLDVDKLRMMYQSVKGARNAGTHGIMSAPTVPGRQFNIWAASAITTKGQIILYETLKHLQNKGIRVVYGDTDGIYIGCSRSAGNLPHVTKALRLNIKPDEKSWLTKPEEAISAIQQCNQRWQKDLNYPDFELDTETHDIMIFVKHKNYLIFDVKNGKLEMTTKGNNFRGSDKANIARKTLKKIMEQVLMENPYWEDEEEARKNIKMSIKNKTREILSKLDLSQVDLNDLTLVQSVQPSKRYKPNQDGSTSTYGRRAEALEKLLGQPIKNRTKFRFVVTKKPLPGITKPSKSGVKPIDYMYPIDLLKDIKEIDLEWYKKMIEKYIQGAFGLSDITVTEQKGLDAWM